MHHDHGLPETNLRHLGDLGNIQVGLNGEGRLETDLKDASLDPASSSTLRGKSLILHEKTDDGSQPTGNSGPRIGCAVIP
jgi:Cu-Zn family superoxide dismutase